MQTCIVELHREWSADNLWAWNSWSTWLVIESSTNSSYLKRFFNDGGQHGPSEGPSLAKIPSPDSWNPQTN